MPMHQKISFHKPKNAAKSNNHKGAMREREWVQWFNKKGGKSAQYYAVTSATRYLINDRKKENQRLAY